jgi:hypothetical protein
MGADEERWRSALMRSTGRTGNFAAASALSVTSDCWLRDRAGPNQNEARKERRRWRLQNGFAFRLDLPFPEE